MGKRTTECDIENEMQWDWTAFWTGVAAVATLGTLAIAIIAYGRGKSRVIVEVESHACQLPANLLQTLENLEDARFYLNRLDYKNKFESQIEDLIKSLIELVNDRALMQFRSQNTTMWLFTVKNDGHEQAEKLELQVPGAIQSLLVESGGTQQSTGSGTIHIRALRPGERVRITTWASSLGFSTPTLLQAKGRAIMRFQKLVPERVEAAYGWAKASGWILLALVVVVAMQLLAHWFDM